MQTLPPSMAWGPLSSPWYHFALALVVVVVIDRARFVLIRCGVEFQRLLVSAGVGLHQKRQPHIHTCRVE